MLPIMESMARKLSKRSRALASASERSHAKRGVDKGRIRGIILRYLEKNGEKHRDTICPALAKFAGRKNVTNSLWQLAQLGYLEQSGDRYRITEKGREQAQRR